MIETVQARCDISTWHGNGMDVVMALDQPRRQSGLWTYGRGGAAVTKGARVSLRVQPVNVGDTKGKMQVIVEGNLTRLLYGDDAKCLSLPPPDVADGVRELIRSARIYLPTLAPVDPEAWKVSRVDANATWDVPEADALDLLNAAGQSLWAWDGYRKTTTSQGGRFSWLYQAGREEQVALYCKSTESGVWLSPESRLVRLEARVMSRKARREYGDTLADLMTEGAGVGMGKVEAWSQKIGRSFVGESNGQTFAALVASGMDTTTAAKMIGPCSLLGHYGVKGCVDDLGIDQRTVYRWAKVLRESGTRAEDLAGGYGVLPAAEDATYADAHFTRLDPPPDDDPVVHGLGAAVDTGDCSDELLTKEGYSFDPADALWEMPRGVAERHSYGDPAPAGRWPSARQSAPSPTVRPVLS